MTTLLLFNWSCNSDDNSNFTQSNENLRLNLLKSGNINQIKSNFKLLNSQQKASVWLSKFDQIIAQDIPIENKNLVIKLKSLLSQSYFKDNSVEVKNTAIKLAQITPTQDFILMFETIENYKYNGKFYGNSISQNLIKDLQSLGNNDYESLGNNNTANPTQRTPDCNCKWMCEYLGSTPTTNCTRTSYGCGFLWLQECTDYA